MLATREQAAIVLREHTYYNTPLFSLKGKEGWVRLVDIYDGDTITIVLVVGGEVRRLQVRLAGIDTCEMRSKSMETRQLAIDAKASLLRFLTGLVLQSDDGSLRSRLNDGVYLVYCVFLEQDKYGRTLANVYADDKKDLSASNMLMHAGLAYAYGGKTKRSEEEQMRSIALSGGLGTF